MKQRINSILVAGVGLALIGSSAFSQSNSSQFSSSSKHLRASQILGSTAQTSQGEKLGEVRDLIVDAQTGQIRMALLSENENSTSGTSGKLIPVPWQAIKMRSDGELVLNLDQNRLKSAPMLESSDSTELDQPEYIVRVYRFFEVPSSDLSSSSSSSSWQSSGSGLSSSSSSGSAYQTPDRTGTSDSNQSGLRNSFAQNNPFRYPATGPRSDEGQSQSGRYGQGSRSGTYDNEAGSRSQWQSGNNFNQDRSYNSQDGSRYDSGRSNQGYSSNSGNYGQGSYGSGAGQSGYTSGAGSQAYIDNQDRFSGNQSQSRYDSDRSNQGYSNNYGQSGYSTGGRPDYNTGRYGQSGGFTSGYGQQGFDQTFNHDRSYGGQGQSRSDNDRSYYGQGTSSSGYGQSGSGSGSGQQGFSRDDNRWNSSSEYRNDNGRGSNWSNQQQSRAENVRGVIRDVDPNSRTIRVDADGRMMLFHVDRAAVLMANGNPGADLRDFHYGQEVQIGYRDEGGQQRALSVADMQHRTSTGSGSR